MHENEKWASVLKHIRQIMEQAGLQHSIKWGTDTYTFQGKNIVGAVGLKNYLALWFHKGVFLKDPENVLSTGKGQKSKSMRQWRIYQPGDVDPAKITHYVQQAIEVEKQGLSIPVDRSMPEIPPILESAMEQHAELREAFNKLTPGRQKEYMQYLIEAKRESTREARLEKIVPMILRGGGLNDKYR